MQNNKVLVWAVLAIIVIGGGWWLLSSGNSAGSSTTGPIKIGFIGPLTGDAAVYGVPVQNGVKLAVDEINRAGGIGGRPIDMIYEDSKCTGQDAASAAQKLVSVDQVKYVVGGVCSAAAFGFEPITSAAQVFAIMPGASAPKLAGMSPYLMRNNPNDNITGVAIADYMAKQYKTAAIISEKTDYAQGIKGVFLTRAQTDGVQVVSTEDYATGISDFRSLLLKVKATKPDVIWINAQTSSNLIRIGEQARQLGITAPFMTAPFNDQSIADAGAVMEGLVTATPPGLAAAGKGAAFVSAYTAAYGAPPQYSFYAGAAYDDVYLLKQAIETAGNDPTKVEQYLHALPSYTGTIGTYHFDQNGDVVGINPVFQKLENGTFVNLPS
jgi:branched-chain amino acid transport system substrate-binding protein